MEDEPKATNSRPVRFAIRAPVRYRMRGEKTWHDGTTVNISRSGVLFEAEDCLATGTQLEMMLAMPVKLRGEPGAKISCQGVVVRTTQRTILAARISGSRLRRS